MFVGHEAFVKEFIKMADSRELAHGYLFHGAQGIGKFTFVNSLANYLENKDFSAEATRPLADCMVLAPENGQSLGIDAVRGVRRFLSSKPTASPYLTVIIDCAETLTTEAENALLKVAEEPTEFALIVFIATDPEDLLPTLRSRLRPVYFDTVSKENIEKILIERGVNKKEAASVAVKAMGRPGLAVKMALDDSFKSILGEAQKFLGASRADKKSIIKSLTDDENFNFDQFLEALMIQICPSIKNKTGIWHLIASTRRESQRFALNPKLQLTALAQALESST
ncbi:MAG: hypothetical protein V1489_02055 [Candidatus Liptonbacteria bacterium]